MKRFEISLYLSLLFLAFVLPNFLYSQNLWQQTNSEVDYPIYDFVSKQNTLFAAFYGAGVYKTTDQGNNWIALLTSIILLYGGCP